MANIFEVPMDNGRTRYQAVDETVGEVRDELFLSLPGALGRGAIDLASLAQLPPELSEENTEVGAYMFTAAQAAALLGNAFEDNLTAAKAAWNIPGWAPYTHLDSSYFIDRNGCSTSYSTIEPDGTLRLHPESWDWHDYGGSPPDRGAAEAIVAAAVGSGREAMAVWAYEVTVNEFGMRSASSKGATVGYMDKHNVFQPQVTIPDYDEHSSLFPFKSRLNLRIPAQPILQRNDR